MNTFLQKTTLLVFWLCLLSNSNTIQAQCGAGYQQVGINWHYQYYNNTVLPPSGINFMLGKNTMNMAWTQATFNGVIAEQTGKAGSYGSNEDIKFTVGNGSVTLTFLDTVRNLKFTVYDIDNKQTMYPQAYNISNVQIPIILTRAAGGSAGTLGGTSINPSYYYSSDALLSSNTAAINVDIAGPVKSVKLSFTKSSGTDPIYISNITACTKGAWATDYQAISAPETGQPTHMLVSYDSIIYVVNKLDNTATQLFNDPSVTRLNTMAYDPYKQIIYYCDSKRDVSNKAVFKYDVKTGVKSTFIANVNTLGIQTFGQGLATGGAGFYDGYLFLGTDCDLNPGTPAAIYRIDLDANGNPTLASRFWGANSAVTVGKSTNILYDWGDFVVNDGVLYNFNGAVNGAAGTELQHFDLNMQTKLAGYSYQPTDTLSQASLDYQGNIFSLRLGQYYQQYNKSTGTFGPKIFYTGIDATRALTDGAESFKYPYDYGDAPSSYGYASHVFRVAPNLMIGQKIDYEMSSFYSTDAQADDNDEATNDEDGVDPAYFLTKPVVAVNATYTIPVKVTNKTGANAYLYGYLDFNGNGNFNDPGERSTIVTIPSSAAMVTVNVNWTSLKGGKVGNSYMRFRLASDSTELRNGSGYAKSGEVEDYQLPILAFNLPVEMVTFTGEALDNHTSLLNWSTASEFNNDYFEIQRSTGNSEWEIIGMVKGHGNSNQFLEYTYTDEHPMPNVNYYRLRQVDFDGQYKFSSEIAVDFKSTKNTDTKANEITVYPNPTSGDVWVKTNGNISTTEKQNIDVYSVNGQQVLSEPQTENTQKVNFTYFENGLYFLKIGNQSFRIIKN